MHVNDIQRKLLPQCISYSALSLLFLLLFAWTPVWAEELSRSRIMTLGRGAMRSGNHEAARDYFRRARPLDTRAHAIADSLLHEAGSYLREGLYDEALAVLTQVADVEGISDAEHSRARLVRAQWLTARAYSGRGDHESAAEVFVSIPGMPEASSDMSSNAILHAGYEYAALGKTEEAFNRFGQVLEKADNPAFHRSRAWLEMGDLYAQRGDYETALRAYEQVFVMKRIPIRHRSLARLKSRQLHEIIDREGIWRRFRRRRGLPESGFPLDDGGLPRILHEDSCNVRVNTEADCRPGTSSFCP